MMAGAVMQPLPQLQPMETPDPLQRYAQIVQLRNAMQNQQYQQQLQPLELQQRRYELGRQQAVNDALKQAYTVDDSGQPQLDVAKATQALSQAGYGEASTGIIDAHVKMLQGLASLKETQGKVADMERDTAGFVGYTAQQAGYDPGVLMHSLQMAQPQYPNEITPLIQRLQQDPTMARPIADQLISASPKVQQMLNEQTAAAARKQQAQTGADRLTLETPGLTADAAQKQAQQAAYQQWSQQPQNQGKNYNDYVSERQAQTAGAEAKARLPYEMQLAGYNKNAAMGNVLAEHSLNTVSDLFVNPQHGYSQTLSQLTATKNAIQNAQSGDQLANSMLPLMTALGVTSFAGVHRINQNEINAAGPQVGSVYRRINALLDKAGSGTLPSQTTGEMNSLMDSLLDAKYSSVLQSAKVAAANGGVDPSKVAVMDKNGNLTRLSDAAKQQPGGAPVLMKAPNGQTKLVDPSEVQHYKSMGATVVNQ